MNNHQGKDKSMTANTKDSAKTKAPDEVEITYKDGYGNKQTHTLMRPIRPGSGEAVLDHAERVGCPDIDDVRAQLRKHYE
jgi:hypothetical protein